MVFFTHNSGPAGLSKRLACSHSARLLHLRLVDSVATDRAEANGGAENTSFAPFLHLKRSFSPDGLGTKIDKVEKNECLFAAGHKHPALYAHKRPSAGLQGVLLVQDEACFPAAAWELHASAHPADAAAWRLHRGRCPQKITLRISSMVYL